jgi:SAM-dependent methyltransferase
MAAFKVDLHEQQRYFRRGDAAHRRWQLGPGYFADTERELLLSTGLPDGGRMLEIGCGEGANLHHLRAAPGSVGVDFSPGKLGVARGDMPGLGFAVADATQLPFADGAFENVLIRDLLHHVLDRQAVVNEAARVVAPGGTVVIIEPNRWNPLILAQMALVPAERGAARSHARQLVGELANAGLEDIALSREQPLPLARVLTHPRVGLAALGRAAAARRFFAAANVLAASVVPVGMWMFLVARARRKRS